MFKIENSIEISAPVSRIRTAASTRDGFRAWFAADTQLDVDGGFSFSFGARGVTLRLDHADDREVALTCVRVRNNPDWLGTELKLMFKPLTNGNTRVELVHAGYPSKDECYERSVVGWAYFLASLDQYVTTGKGTPFVAEIEQVAS
jgi:hypothetical protein